MKTNYDDVGSGIKEINMVKICFVFINSFRDFIISVLVKLTQYEYILIILQWN